MARSRAGILNRLADSNALRRWSKIADSAPDLPMDELRAIRARAKGIRREINKVIGTADERSIFPVSGADLIRGSDNADWRWRPDVWKTRAHQSGLAAMTSGDTFADYTKVFHDCELNENTIRQIPNVRSIDLAPYGIRLDFLRFTGSFFSVVFDLPAQALSGLSKQHVIRADVDVSSDREVKTFARLNLKQGPNTETMVVELSNEIPAVFDLGFADVSENHVDGAWVEIIFESPGFTEITVRDFTLCRHPRAEI